MYPTKAVICGQSRNASAVIILMEWTEKQLTSSDKVEEYRVLTGLAHVPDGMNGNGHDRVQTYHQTKAGQCEVRAHCSGRACACESLSKADFSVQQQGCTTLGDSHMHAGWKKDPG